MVVRDIKQEPWFGARYNHVSTLAYADISVN